MKDVTNMTKLPENKIEIEIANWKGSAARRIAIKEKRRADAIIVKTNAFLQALLTFWSTLSSLPLPHIELKKPKNPNNPKNPGLSVTKPNRPKKPKKPK
jgi:hypothetical protein